MEEKIKRAIESALDEATAYIFDPMQDGQHFESIVVSPAFEGMSLVNQHRTVMNALKMELDSNAVHALALKTFTPEEWAQQRDQYEHLIGN